MGKQLAVKASKFSNPYSRVKMMDNMEFMKSIPDKFFSLAIVDPPYGINAPNMQMGSNPNRSRTDGYGSGPSIGTNQKLKGKLNNGRGKLKDRILNQSAFDWDNEVPSPEYFKELFRVSENQIIWGGNYFDLPPTRCIICWDKMQPWDNFSQWEMAWTSFDRPAKMYKISNTGGKNDQKKFHPTQKPVKLYDCILRDFAKPGFKIIDTHLGSGTLRLSCWKAGLHFEGTEISPDYFELHHDWFTEMIKQNQIRYIPSFSQEEIFPANGKEAVNG